MSDLLNTMLKQHDVQQPKPRTPLGPRSAVIRSIKRPAPTATVQPTPRGAIAESAVAFLWLIGWGLNGLSTVALGWLPFVNWFSGRLGHGDAIWLSLWLQVPIGIVIHIFVSRIEQDLWRQAKPVAGETIEQRAIRLLRSIRTWEAVIIGSLDSLTAALGVLFFAQAFGVGASWTLLIIGGLFGTALAMVVEPMLKYHGQALQRMLWRR